MTISYCSRGNFKVVLATGVAGAAIIVGSPAYSQSATPSAASQGPEALSPAQQSEVPALAQTSGAPVPQDPAPQTEAAAAAEIVVTGSSIRGVAPVGSPLIGVTRETIQAVAPTNVKDLLATVPQLGNFGANAEQSSPGRFRNAGFQPNIHNLGPYATLTLINGHRQAAVGAEASSIDPSTVPTIAIQRVELVADGASAVYGSDAVAGVVNFIYRKPFDGIETSGTYSFNDTRYRRRNAGILAGKVWNGGGALIAYEYSDNRAPLNTEIPTLALGGNQTSRGGRDLRGTNCLNPTIRGVNAAGIPTGATYAYPSYSTALADRQCGILYPVPVIEEGTRHAVLATVEHQVTDTLRLWAEANFGNYSTVTPRAAPNFAVIIPNTNPFFRYAPAQVVNGVAPTRVSVTRSGVNLFPNFETRMRSRFYAITAGLDFDVGHDWKTSAMVHVSQSRDTFSLPNYDAQALIDAANGTTTATALNPFGQAADNNKAVLDKITSGFNYGQFNKNRNELYELQVKADGPIVKIPGGEIRAAIGIDFRTETLDGRQTGGSDAPGASFFIVTRDDHISRNVNAAFAELNVPLVSELNEMSFVKRLTLSLPGRADHYNRYGTKFNPKVGLVFSPINGLNLRGSYGTNFAAPNLGLLTTTFGQPQVNVNFATPVGYGPYKGQTLQNINVYNFGGGNPLLDPEEAKTYSLGFDFTPDFLKGLRVGATYYHVRYSNLVYKLAQADVLNNDFPNARVVFFPSQAVIDDYVRRYPTTGQITTNFDVLLPSYAINLGSRTFGGIDLDVSYRLATRSLGTFNLAINANRQVQFDERIIPNTATIDRIGTELAPRWKTRYTGGWNYGPITVTSFVNYTSGFRNLSVTPNQQVKSFTTVDLAVAYEFKKIFKGVSLQVRSTNLFDRQPPFYDSANGYFPALASPYGRTIDLSVRAKF